MDPLELLQGLGPGGPQGVDMDDDLLLLLSLLTNFLPNNRMLRTSHWFNISQSPAEKVSLRTVFPRPPASAIQRSWQKLSKIMLTRQKIM